MDDNTEPLRDEHKELSAKIELLRIAAEAVGAATVPTLQLDIAKIDDFLRHEVLPHAFAEEEVLYITVGKILGPPQATATMSCDHVAISGLAAQLRQLRSGLTGGALDAATSNDLRRVLYGLYALLKGHLAKEEEVYFPLLDAHLGAHEMHQLLHKMTEAEKAAAPSRGN